MIQYTIQSKNPSAHYFDVTLHIAKPDPAGQLVRLPAWIPGSYMIRDFARNIVEISAFCNDAPVSMQQQDKSSWLIQTGSRAVDIKYRVYAWDLSVRSAHLDNTHGFFNGSSVFLEVVGQGDMPCEVEIKKPEHDNCRDWRLATTLDRKQVGAGFDDFSFGAFRAKNYLELIDHPVEMGDFTQFEFDACGIRHDVVLTGRFDCDYDRLKIDLEKICEHHINFFGQPAPMSRYMFLVMVVGEGYGGLEHRSSTSLVCSRHDLPKPGQSEASEQYRTFLGLCSHEYFHSWNVKRIKPAVFDNPDLSQEVYTPLLWAFEGITSYYDDLALVRCGCISSEQYLELLAQMITRVQRTTGRKRQSAAESSFNAWSKFYKQDENAANAIVSYYAKGCLIALCIDLKIREITQHKKTLDDVMLILWNKYQQDAAGIHDTDIQNIISALAGVDLSGFLEGMIYGREELPLQELLSGVSVDCQFRASIDQLDKGGKVKGIAPTTSFGANVKETPAGLNILALKESGVAQVAGLSAGDDIVAINGIRADLKTYQSWVKYSAPLSRHQLQAFRRDELMQFEVVLQAPEKNAAVLTVVDEASDSLKDWLSLNR
jgi:predicted metalloprotease with PDZ domain